MPEVRLRLGETLIEAGVITRETLEKALQLQKKQQLRLGTILLQEGFVTESQLVQALSLKLSVPWVSLWRIDIPNEVIDLVPCNVAEEFFIIPIYIRQTNKGERVLFVAMNDPADEDAIKFVTAAAGMSVKPMIAGPSDIAEAIRAYYYDEEIESDTPPPPFLTSIPQPDSQPSKKQPPPAPVTPKTRTSSFPPQTTQTPKSKQKDKPSAKLSQESSPILQDKRHEDQKELSGKGLYGLGDSMPSGGFALTLLDGTTISFGSAKKQSANSLASTPDQISKEDLLAGLKAAASGTPIEDFLPAVKWESYIAALLKILMDKHLILHDEFLRELKDIEKD